MTPSPRRLHPDVKQKLRRFGLPGTLRLVVDLPVARHTLRRVLPFKRAWKIILIAAAIDAALMVPAVMTFGGAMQKWRTVDSLFDLTTLIFLAGWAIGWSIAPLIVTLFLIVATMGREVLIGRPGILQIGIGLPGLILCVDFDARKIVNLRLSEPQAKSGLEWRGTHISFDYDDQRIDFGSAMTARDLSVITREIELATHGEAQTPNPALSQTENIALEFDSPPAFNVVDVPKPVTITSLSTLVLIASNLVPLVGAFYFGWRLSDIMVLYWAESAVVAFYNLAKIVYIGKWAAAFIAVFFLAHFSVFMAVHFLFIYTLFIEGPQHTSGGDLREVAALFISLWPALVALVVSHGVSFATNFLGNREYERVTIKQQMAAPYSRIALMQVTLIFGGFVTMALGDAVPVLLFFILVKIVFDVKAHLKEHERAENRK